MEKYFNIRYEFDKKEVERRIDETLANNGHGYIPVADGVVLNTANRDKDYMKVMDEALFAICDSSWVPLYVKWIYGRKREQYCGSMIFPDLVKRRVGKNEDLNTNPTNDSGDADKDSKSKYRMAFLGTNTATLEALRENVAKKMNPDVKDMLFYELPFCKVEEFDYPAIAKMLEEDGADIIWVALGAPKQEQFMNRLDKHLKRGVQIAVGAVFKFFSGQDEKRAPKWVVRTHMEFIYRIMQDPKKQLKRCGWIIVTLPGLFFGEVKRKRQAKKK